MGVKSLSKTDKVPKVPPWKKKQEREPNVKERKKSKLISVVSVLSSHLCAIEADHNVCCVCSIHIRCVIVLVVDKNVQ